MWLGLLRAPLVRSCGTSPFRDVDDGIVRALDVVGVLVAGSKVLTAVVVKEGSDRVLPRIPQHGASGFRTKCPPARGSCPIGLPCRKRHEDGLLHGNPLPQELLLSA